MLRVLQVVPNMHAAGLETFIMNVYRNIDRSKVQFDFLVHYKERYFYDDEIERLGGKIYRLTFRDDSNIFNYCKSLNAFFKKHRYLVVHGHMPSTALFYLYYAKKYNVPIRILHSHNTSTEDTLKGKIKYLLLSMSKKYANKYFACSNAAGKFLYGNKKFEVIKNAINLDHFSASKTDDEKRRILDKRKELNLDNKIVIGHIGRFNTQKNHKFLINVFKEIKKIYNNTILILVGEGELKKEIQQYAKDQELINDIIFLGIRSDVDDLYQIFDLFLLPSLFEGLPVVGVESQASGVMTLVSDKVTPELKMSSIIEFLPLLEKAWIKRISELIDNGELIKHYNVSEEMGEAGYDIKRMSVDLMHKYLEMSHSTN